MWKRRARDVENSRNVIDRAEWSDVFQKLPILSRDTVIPTPIPIPIPIPRAQSQSTCVSPPIFVYRKSMFALLAIPWRSPKAPDALSLKKKKKGKRKKEKQKGARTTKTSVCHHDLTYENIWVSQNRLTTAQMTESRKLKVCNRSHAVGGPFAPGGGPD